MDAMTTTSEDVTQMSDTELAEQAQKIDAERARRATLTEAERTTDDMALAYLEAAGRVNGADWEAPTGFIGAYPRGWRVTLDGRAFEAVAPGTVTAPPGDCWNEVDPTTALVPFWEPGEHPAGALVRDAGQTWRARTDVDGPRPSEYPGGWELI